eukprot:Skav224417  [mRNA]  locus=scaffold657:289501:289857:- [translate_table: standard]
MIPSIAKLYFFAQNIGYAGSQCEATKKVPCPECDKKSWATSSDPYLPQRNLILLGLSTSSSMKQCSGTGWPGVMLYQMGSNLTSAKVAPFQPLKSKKLSRTLVEPCSPTGLQSPFLKY